jgi:hypothetical protein
MKKNIVLVATVFFTITLFTLIIGCGQTNNGTASTTSTTSDSTGRTWAQAVTTNYTTRDSAPCVVFNNKIFVLGGYKSSGPTSEVIYSSDGVTWGAYVATWPPREKCSAVVHDSAIWIFGGARSSQVFSDVWKSDATGLIWTQVTPDASDVGSREFDFNSMVSYGNKLWVGGGDDGNDNDYKDVWSSANGIDWEQEKIFIGAWASFYTFNGSLYFSDILGLNPTTVEVFSYNGSTWSVSTSEYQSSFFQSNPIAHDSKLWQLGAFTAPNQTTNEVWSSTNGTGWTCVTRGASWARRDRAATASFLGKLWIMGGRIKVEPGPDVKYKDVWYSPSN